MLKQRDAVVLSFNPKLCTVTRASTPITINSYLQASTISMYFRVAEVIPKLWKRAKDSNLIPVGL